jgi:hypothetical protein
MSSKIEALPLPRQKAPGSRIWWIAALLAALLVAASLGSYLALRQSGSEANPPAGHSVVVPPAAPALRPAQPPSGPQVKEIRDVGGLTGIPRQVIDTGGTGSGPAEIGGSDSSNAQPRSSECWMVRHGPC